MEDRVLPTQTGSPNPIRERSMENQHMLQAETGARRNGSCSDLLDSSRSLHFDLEQAICKVQGQSDDDIMIALVTEPELRESLRIKLSQNPYADIWVVVGRGFLAGYGIDYQRYWLESAIGKGVCTSTLIRRWFALLQDNGFKELHCKPLTRAHVRLYERIGFVYDQSTDTCRYTGE
jgi:hypothetical protein